MKSIEIEIIPVSGESVSVSVNFSAPGSTPIIRRWHVERSTLDEISATIEEIVERALSGRVRGGEGPAAAAGGGPAESLENAGRTFFEALFRQQCDRLRTALSGGDLYFIFKVDRSLAYLPFEVLHDGARFLSMDFALGRVIYSESGHQAAGGVAGGDRVLILGDPSDDASIRDDVEREVDSLRDLFKKEGGYGITIGMGREVSERMVLSLLPETALLHFTGHGAAAADGTAGLELYGGRVLSAEAFRGVSHPPAVAFFNTCSTASHKAWKSPLGIMEALISRGTRACIAPVWDVTSSAATSFALAFYRHLLKDETFGEAMRKARADVARNGDPGDPTWAAYALYGDPLSTPRTPGPAVRDRSRAGVVLRIALAVTAALLLLLTPRTMDRRMTDVVVPVEVGYVIFESEPADARIFLDGQDVGLTPAAIEVSVGDHQVALMKKGYRRWQASVDVKKGPETVVRAVLQKTDE